MEYRRCFAPPTSHSADITCNPVNADVLTCALCILLNGAQKGISREKRRSCQQRARVGSHKSTSAASYESSFLTCTCFARAKIQVKSVKCGPLRIPRYYPHSPAFIKKSIYHSSLSASFPYKLY
uniref:Uncharacterized protein n=1 Tax=Takifugu rubripes TaxID=31033 RepID=A0A3B5K1N5_TAKRU